MGSGPTIDPGPAENASSGYTGWTQCSKLAVADPESEILRVDDRGTARRGLKFERPIKNQFGSIDPEDQITCVQWLIIIQGLAIAGRIGMYGWSYGSYLSAMSLLRFSDVFCCAILGAPVTSWDGYNTFYTEKYMGLPDDNTNQLKGKLLFIHGMIDENVHFRHIARLVNALVIAGTPRKRRDGGYGYMEERIWDFIEKEPVKMMMQIKKHSSSPFQHK